ncbi:MAG TPA: FGGY family carbohydrate kinase [Niabella sp.]|nr:FGGY family carbohydrate kinase [Niabella sp.]HOZ97819.1 FGGY family carbohydrate kinase [Niabella sp.]HQW15658.1 FGGY family carbohydrate kinase [Niabella sp.]HQX20825.1 FGGY family carbohydrate kinase [Niabella sp.]HQX42075.1 FGGY family carbohydrate kinase [Niabella sp.]
MLLLGIDVGTSSIKVSVVDAATQQTIASAQFPEAEREIISPKPGWAEQSPERWWMDVKAAIALVHQTGKYNSRDIGAIGISYQMHGLVMLDKVDHVLRNSIIWCDSRAVPFGQHAFESLGEHHCLQTLLNSPGNFTASKLAWVKENEPELFAQIDKIMLPGDYIAYKLTGKVTTSSSALSEAVLWNFKTNSIATTLMDFYGFDQSIIPDVQEVFSNHGIISKQVAEELSFQEGIGVTYKAGDQPNNALSLNVMQPGDVAATAGTSGVIYGVSDQPTFDPQSRVNSFAHVNHSPEATRVGVLLCINGTGILNRWIKNLTGNTSYADMNEMASNVEPGSEGLFVLPFGNGAERILNNKIAGAHVENIDLNKHSTAHIVRASQEGIAFAFRYGLDIMRSNGMHPAIIRAGRANMFLSPVFTEAFVNVTNIPVELYDCDGSVGAALGAGIGSGYFQNMNEAFSNVKPLITIQPKQAERYNVLYEDWKNILTDKINRIE